MGHRFKLHDLGIACEASIVINNKIIVIWNTEIVKIGVLSVVSICSVMVLPIFIRAEQFLSSLYVIFIHLTLIVLPTTVKRTILATITATIPWYNIVVDFIELMLLVDCCVLA